MEKPNHSHAFQRVKEYLHRKSLTVKYLMETKMNILAHGKINDVFDMILMITFHTMMPAPQNK